MVFFRSLRQSLRHAVESFAGPGVVVRGGKFQRKQNAPRSRAISHWRGAKEQMEGAIWTIWSAVTSHRVPLSAPKNGILGDERLEQLRTSMIWAPAQQPRQIVEWGFVRIS